MSLDDCQRKHTHRQYLAWQRWLDDELNRPGRIEYYLMQIDRTIRILVNAFTKARLKLGFDDLKIKWGSTTSDSAAEAEWNELDDQQEEDAEVIEEVAAEQKQRWGMALAVAQGLNLNRERNQ